MRGEARPGSPLGEHPPHDGGLAPGNDEGLPGAAGVGVCPAGAAVTRRGTRQTVQGLWVPKTLSPYATWAYSRIMPPSRSRRKTRTFALGVGG
jgi:hypothetical protein